MPEYARYIRAGVLDKPYLAPQEKDLIEKNKWAPIFKNQIRLSKVRIDVLRPWLNKRITELMGIEDEILVEYIMTQLKDSLQNEKAKDLSEIKYLDPKILVLNLTGFMANKAQPFVAELWEHLLSAQNTEHGVPIAFIQDKKHEIEVLKEKSKLLENDLAQQREVKKESALEEIANRHKSTSLRRDRVRTSSPTYRRRDRDTYSRRHRRSRSSSRSKSISRSRSRSRSISRDTHSTYRDKGYRERDHRDKGYRDSPYRDKSHRDLYRDRSYRDRRRGRYRRHRSRSVSRSRSSSRSRSRDTYTRQRRRSRSMSSDSMATPSPRSSRSVNSSVEDNMSTSE